MPKKVTALQLDRRPPCVVLLTTQTHAGLHVRGFLSEVSSSLFKGEETRCVATMDGSRLICAYEKAVLPCNKGYTCFLLTGGTLCGRHQRSNVTVYIKHLCLTHYASLGYGPSPVEIWMPNMESTAAQAPITQRSHLSQTHAHTDTAVFSLINKK